MPNYYERKATYKRDNTDRFGQGLLPWAPGKALSTSQAAERIGVSEDTITRMCEAGEIEAYRLRPQKRKSPWRIPTIAVDRHILRVLERAGMQP